MVCVLGAGVFFATVSGDPLPIDNWWHDHVAFSRGSASFAVAVFFAEVGGSIGAAACTAIAAALLLALKRPRDAGAVVTALLLGVASSEIIKAFVVRPRPLDELYFTTGHSFPSGHSMGAAALAVSLALVFTRWRGSPYEARAWPWTLAAGWTLLMMLSRTGLHVHWFTDVFAGAALGISAAVFSRLLWEKDPGAANVRGAQ